MINCLCLSLTILFPALLPQASKSWWPAAGFPWMPLPAAAAAAAAGAVAVVYRGVDGVPLPALWPLVLLLAALLLVTPMFIAKDPHRLPLAARARRDEDHEFDGELAVEQAPSALAQEVGDRLFGEGEALEHGDSGPADMAAAAHKYVEAAGMGHPASLAKTGLFRMQGLGGLPRDEAEGVRLLRNAMSKQVAVFDRSNRQGSVMRYKSNREGCGTR